jgi:hypothetical protein
MPRRGGRDQAKQREKKQQQGRAKHHGSSRDRLKIGLAALWAFILQDVEIFVTAAQASDHRTIARHPWIYLSHGIEQANSCCLWYANPSLLVAWRTDVLKTSQ